MEAPQRNLAMDLVRVTEAAALASARWLGKGAKNEGDGAAVDAMRLSFNSLDIDGRIVIGEGEKDEAPMLFNGEHVGTGRGAAVDVAVDPVEGTNLLAYGRPNAISVVGLAPAGAMFDPGPSYYMKKLVVPMAAKDVVDINAPVADNLLATARALGKKVEDLVIFVLDKPRHKDLIAQIRTAGARIQLHTDGDVAGALMAVDPASNVDMMMGTGGTPEGVLAACAIKALGGQILAQLDPQSPEERDSVVHYGLNLEDILTTDTLIRDDNVFFAATGISGGTFLGGVQYTSTGAITHSMVVRGKTGTFRRIISTHQLDKLLQFSAIKY
ncbi:MAG: class II fructose-bisphosphatase [Desulfomicrobium sp.]|nr:class II fructose-bisphosphatase [Desulfomicrobium sp.]NLV97299.1 class II fructose-bisphosphatase [Desulfovibrionales bacterium]